VPGNCWQVNQVVNAGDPPGRGPFDQEGEQVNGGQSIIECSMRRLVLKPQPSSEFTQLEVGDLINQEPSCKCQRVQALIAKHGTTPAAHGHLNERHVKA
jgi:hypothetical protein